VRPGESRRSALSEAAGESRSVPSRPAAGWPPMPPRVTVLARRLLDRRWNLIGHVAGQTLHGETRCPSLCMGPALATLKSTAPDHLARSNAARAFAV
jgi:hypothetical protein